jgi:vacuolar-type H+-ATPase subunit H
VTNDELRKRAEQLIREGKMPTLRELNDAVLKVRQKYAYQIRRARRESKLERDGE